MSPHRQRDQDSFMSVLKQEKANMDKIVRFSREELRKVRNEENDLKNKPQTFEIEQYIDQIKSKIYKTEKDVKRITHQIQRIDESFDQQAMARQQFQKYQKLKYEFFMAYQKHNQLQSHEGQLQRKLTELNNKVAITDNQFAKAIEQAKSQKLKVSSNPQLLKLIEKRDKLKEKAGQQTKGIFLVRANFNKKCEMLERQIRILENITQSVDNQISGKSSVNETLLVDLDDVVVKNSQKGDSLNKILRRFTQRRKTIDIAEKTVVRGKSTFVSRVSNTHPNNTFTGQHQQFLSLSNIQVIAPNLKEPQATTEQTMEPAKTLNVSEMKSSKLSFREIVESRKIKRRKKTKFTEESRLQSDDMKSTMKQKNNQNLEQRPLNLSKASSIRESIKSRSSSLSPPTKTYGEIQQTNNILDESRKAPFSVDPQNSNQFMDSFPKAPEFKIQINKTIESAEEGYYKEVFEPESARSSIIHMEQNKKQPNREFADAVSEDSMISKGAYLKAKRAQNPEYETLQKPEKKVEQDPSQFY